MHRRPTRRQIVQAAGHVGGDEQRRAAQHVVGDAVHLWQEGRPRRPDLGECDGGVLLRPLDHPLDPKHSGCEVGLRQRAGTGEGVERAGCLGALALGE